MKWLTENEPLLKLVFRLAVLAIAIFGVQQLDRIYWGLPTGRDIAKDVDKIQRDIESLASKAGAPTAREQDNAEQLRGYTEFYGAARTPPPATLAPPPPAPPIPDPGALTKERP